MSRNRPRLAPRLSWCVGAALLVVGSTVTAGELAGFPVRFLRGNSVKGLTIADLDGDGRLSIVATVGETVAVIGADGKLRPGFPVSLRGAGETVPVSFEAAPTVCDLNGDGKGEILVGGSTHKLYALTGAGTPVAGFPVMLDGLARGAVACVPSKEAHRFDVALSTDAGSLVMVASAGVVFRTVAKIGRGAEGGVAVAALDFDGVPYLITGGGDSRLYVFDTTGKPRKGFPYKMAFRTSATPAVGDIDDDGRPDIIVGSQDFKIHAVDADGKPLKGFPVDTGYRLYAGVALADVDGDGVLEAVVGSGDKSLYVLNGRGQALKGFPVTTGDRFDYDAAVGDLGKSGTQEIVIAGADGTLYQVGADGKKSAIELDGKATGAPALADLDGDGIPEVVVATQENAIHVLHSDGKGKAETALLAWPMAGHDAAHTGRFGPNPGRCKDLTLAKTPPFVTDALVVKYRFFDLDGDPERETQIRWFKDGAREPGFDNLREIKAGQARKHEKWHYTLQEGANFKAYGEHGVLTRIYTSTPVEVLNTPPMSPEIRLSPAEPKATSGLEVAVTKPSVDVDGDAVHYRYVWLKNDRPQKLDVSTTRVAAHLTHKNEIWQVVVVPFDGEVEGTPSVAAVKIHNTPPGPFTIAPEPASPKIDDTLTIKVTRAASDDDGDVVRYTYRTWVDGALVDLPEASPSIPPRSLRKHEQVRVEVTAHDDEEAGAKTSVELTVANTPPPTPLVTIWPAHPRTTDDLSLGLTKEPRDADQDLVTLKHQWTVDGAKVAFPVTVPHEQTKKGQTWQLTVTPHDGEADGGPITVSTRIENTPPSKPEIELARYSFATDEEVTPRIKAPPADVDNDPIRLRYLWKKNGAPAAFPDTKATLFAADTTKGETWEVSVLGNDGEADGEAASVRFTIRNTPPTAPQIAVSLDRPTVTDKVEVRVTRDATDKDNDPLQYRYRYFKDGVAQAKWPLTKKALEPSDFKKGEHWRVEVKAFDGEEEGEAAVAEVRPQNHVPSPPVVVIRPSPAKTTDELVCARTTPGSDPDLDPLTYRTRWLVDGQPVALSPELDRLPPALTKKGQSWICEVTAFDGLLSSVPARSPGTAIVNSPPSPPKIAISPPSPKTDVALACELTVPAADADLDRLQYHFAWKVDGKPFAATSPSAASPGMPASRVPASATRRGQTWECEVVADDGAATAPGVTARTVIENSPPLAPRIKVKPERPLAGDELACDIVDKAVDVDQDEVHYRYVWLKDGVPQSFSPTSTTVPGRLVKANDLWRCQVTPNDGTANGPSVESADVMVKAR